MLEMRWTRGGPKTCPSSNSELSGEGQVGTKPCTPRISNEQVFGLTNLIKVGFVPWESMVMLKRIHIGVILGTDSLMLFPLYVRPGLVWNQLFPGASTTGGHKELIESNGGRTSSHYGVAERKRIGHVTDRSWRTREILVGVKIGSGRTVRVMYKPPNIPG
jgi:hypothetical protein